MKKVDQAKRLRQHVSAITPSRPLVAKTPHLMKTVIGKVTGSPMGEPEYFLTAEMFFPDAERFSRSSTTTILPRRTCSTP